MSRTTIVLDACLIITFGNAEALQVVAELQEYDVAVAKLAAREVTRPPAVDELRRFVEAGNISTTGIDLDIPAEVQALARFDALPAFRGRGDAEVLALAAAREWIVGSDERAIRRTAQAEFGASRLAGTLDFLRWAVSEHRLALEDGVRLLHKLDVGSSLVKRLAAAGLAPENVLGGES